MVEKGEKGYPPTLVLVAALNEEEEGIGLTLADVKNFLNEAFCPVVDGRSTEGTARAFSVVDSCSAIRLVDDVVAVA